MLANQFVTDSVSLDDSSTTHIKGRHTVAFPHFFLNWSFPKLVGLGLDQVAFRGMWDIHTEVCARSGKPALNFSYSMYEHQQKLWCKTLNRGLLILSAAEPTFHVGWLSYTAARWSMQAAGRRTLAVPVLCSSYWSCHPPHKEQVGSNM